MGPILNSLGRSQERQKEFMETDDWRVLLIGGNSGAGKTHLAKALVRPLGVPFLMVDDIRIALQQATTPEQHPDLHVFLNYQPEQWESPDAIVQDWLRVGKAMVKPLREIMAHHILVESSGKIIIEGDGILPDLVKQDTFDEIAGFENIALSQKVHAVFLIEENEEEILNNLRARGRGFILASEAFQTAFARASVQFGQWLVQEAQRNQIHVLTARPQETIVERLREIIL
jgi:2-phosphoglycerate kinase